MNDDDDDDAGDNVGEAGDCSVGRAPCGAARRVAPRELDAARAAAGAVAACRACGGTARWQLLRPRVSVSGCCCRFVRPVGFGRRPRATARAARVPSGEARAAWVGCGPRGPTSCGELRAVSAKPLGFGLRDAGWWYSGLRALGFDATIGAKRRAGGARAAARRSTSVDARRRAGGARATTRRGTSAGARRRACGAGAAARRGTSGGARRRAGGARATTHRGTSAGARRRAGGWAGGDSVAAHGRRATTALYGW